MMFIEVFAPKGALGHEQRRHLGERLSAELTYEESAPAAVIAAGRALVQVVFHEPGTWITGDGAPDPGVPPRYLVRVSLPRAWREEAAAELISRVTRVLADSDAQRVNAEPVVWVQVIGVPEGGYGRSGRVMRSTDIIMMIVNGTGRRRAFAEEPQKEMAQ
ncbi:hypothetical protein Psi02_31470 [Planotetraspora silvatica]|uniref:Uncharacterized protein n=1 Tax=Planotetraspora silvatica TaxID=234614 RepID=A0A8J3UJ65_9ACTN|nr:hypothetical protein [Planotetraspora silvatica]GII46723.1 hypothetical protein Psi02_31470 [Planotetraspora silvatica]